MTRIRIHSSCTSLFAALVMSVLSVLMVGACSSNPVGRECFSGTDAGTDQETVIASPAIVIVTSKRTGGPPTPSLSM